MAAFGLAACNKKKPELANSGAFSNAGGPAWVAKCGGAFPDAGKDAFYGCGSMIAVENLPLQVQSADARARTDLARNIDAFVADFFKDFLDSAGIKEKIGKGLAELEEKKFISGISKDVTESALAGALVVNHWRNPADDMLYSLDKVSFDNVSAGMEKQMRQHAKEINLDADDAVKELDLAVVKKRWE